MDEIVLVFDPRLKIDADEFKNGYHYLSSLVIDTNKNNHRYIQVKLPVSKSIQ